jgi:hypothetical protein
MWLQRVSLGIKSDAVHVSSVQVASCDQIAATCTELIVAQNTALESVNLSITGRVIGRDAQFEV